MKLKNWILKAVSWVAFYVLAFCACSVDTYDLRPLAIPALVSSAWLALFIYANCVWEGGEKHGER